MTSAAEPHDASDDAAHDDVASADAATDAGAAVADANEPPLFYRKIIERAELARAMDVQGIDQEIGILRSELDKQGHDVNLVLKSVQLIVRAVTARYRMSGQSKEQFEAAFNATLEQVSQSFKTTRGYDDV